MNQYFTVIIYLVIILIIVASMLLVNRFLDDTLKDKKASNEPFECGAVPIQENNTIQVPLSYYKVAIIFVLFDLEGIFLFFCALAAKPMSDFIFATFLFFMLILVLIIFYVIKEGVLSFPIKVRKG